MTDNSKEHWEIVYKTKETNSLGWYEKTPTACINLFSKLALNKNETILEVGAGASTFIDYLVEQGYENVIACDISEAALEKLKDRLGREKASKVSWIVDDITCPAKLGELRDVTLWHDRAMLHFLREKQQREMYLSTLKKVVKKDGYVIIAAFSTTGAKKCSGLDLVNYDQQMLSDFLGEEFRLIEHFDYTYQMPSGDLRSYIYTLFKRV